MPRFACATWRPISVNYSAGLGPNLGLILHHQAGNGSLYNFFNSRAAEVSAHFWVSKTGVIEQYVDTGARAWHGRSLNTRYVGVETEGCPGGRDEPLTEAQVNAMARIYAEGMRVHGWRNAKANKDGDPGLGYHRMAVATACPCDLRLQRRDEILRRAAGGTAAPAPPPASAPPAGKAPPYPGRVLKQGVRGDDVRQWQAKMRDRNWKIDVDGDYGPQSDSYCRQFQRNKGLTVDGLVGPVTWDATWTTPVT